MNPGSSFGVALGWLSPGLVNLCGQNSLFCPLPSSKGICTAEWEHSIGPRINYTGGFITRAIARRKVSGSGGLLLRIHFLCNFEHVFTSVCDGLRSGDIFAGEHIDNDEVWGDARHTTRMTKTMKRPSAQAFNINKHNDII
jgi:hypothetical protein